MKNAGDAAVITEVAARVRIAIARDIVRPPIGLGLRTFSIVTAIGAAAEIDRGATNTGGAERHRAEPRVDRAGTGVDIGQIRNPATDGFNESAERPRPFDS
jgi:hypothetical protein